MAMLTDQVIKRERKEPTFQAVMCELANLGIITEEQFREVCDKKATEHVPALKLGNGFDKVVDTTVTETTDFTGFQTEV